MLLGAVGFVAGFGYAFLRTSDSYTCSMNLMRAKNPQTASYSNARREFTDPYTHFSSQVLTRIAYSQEVRERLVEKLGDHIPKNEILGNLQFFAVRDDGAQESGIYEIQATCSLGAEEAYQIAQTWADCFMERANEVQRAHSNNDRELYTQRIAKKEREAAEANKALQLHIKTHGVQEGTGAITTKYQRKQSLLDEQLNLDLLIEKEIALEDSARQELNGEKYLRQSLADLQRQREERRQVLTEDHPDMLTLNAKIHRTNEKLQSKSLISAEASDPAEEALELQDYRLYELVTRSRAEKERLQKLREIKGAEVQKIDEDLLNLTELVNYASTLRKTYETKSNAVVGLKDHIDDLAFLDEKSPPILKVLDKASPDKVAFWSKSGKMRKFGALGAGFALSIGFALGLLRELLAPRLGTLLQAAITTKAMPVVNYPPAKNSDQAEERSSIWTNLVLSKLPHRRRILLRAVGTLKQEQNFWQDLIDGGASRHRQILIADPNSTPLALTYNGSPVPWYQAGETSPVCMIHLPSYQPAQLAELVAAMPEQFVLLYRWADATMDDVSVLAASIDDYYLLVGTSETDRSRASNAARSSMALLGEPTGLITLNKKPMGILSTQFSNLQSWLARLHKSNTEAAHTVTSK